MLTTLVIQTFLLWKQCTTSGFQVLPKQRGLLALLMIIGFSHSVPVELMHSPKVMRSFCSLWPLLSLPMPRYTFNYRALICFGNSMLPGPGDS